MRIMRLLSAVGLTLVCFLALFSFQLLWTHDRLEHLRDLGRRGLHIRSAGRRQQLETGAEQIGALLDRLASAGADLDQVAGDAVAMRTDGGAAGEGSLRGGPHSMPNPAIIVFCYNRTDYLNQTLHSLMGLQGLSRYSLYISQVGAGRLVRRLQLHGRLGALRLVVTCRSVVAAPVLKRTAPASAPPRAPQDGNSPGVAELVGQLGASLRRAARDFAFWQKAPRVAQLPGAKQPGHAWLAQHYKWGLDRVFNERGHSHVIIVEDDMLFSPGGCCWEVGETADIVGSLLAMWAANARAKVCRAQDGSKFSAFTGPALLPVVVVWGWVAGGRGGMPFMHAAAKTQHFEQQSLLAPVSCCAHHWLQRQARPRIHPHPHPDSARAISCAADFLLYFEATAPLLHADPSLWCISSWNDNGFEKGHGWDVRKLFRTSYFPGGRLSACWERMRERGPGGGGGGGR